MKVALAWIAQQVPKGLNSMPLATLIFSDCDHVPFASDATTANHCFSALALPGPRRGSLHVGAAAFIGEEGAAAKELDGLGGEGKYTSLGQVQLPKRGALDELGSACKISLGPKSSSGPDETLSAKDQGVDVAKAAQCTQTGGEVVLEGFFGQALPGGAPGGAVGVELRGSSEVPVSSLMQKQLQAAQDTCHDFSNVVLHRLGRPGHQANTTIGADDAAHMLRAYGRCLMSMGEASSAAGCRLGQFKREGAGETEHMCQETLGPSGTECAVM